MLDVVLVSGNLACLELGQHLLEEEVEVIQTRKIPVGIRRGNFPEVRRVFIGDIRALLIVGIVVPDQGRSWKYRLVLPHQDGLDLSF